MEKIIDSSESIIEIDPNILIFLNIQIEKLKNAGLKS
jgi:hypothetical protein